MAKVMRKEARHTQRWDRASGVPWKFSSIYPQNQSLPTLLLCAVTYTSDFTGGCPPLPLSEKRVNLQLQLIKFLGVTRVFQPTNSFGSPLLLLLLLSRFSRVRLCATPQTAVHQALPSLGFSRQEHWSGLPLPSPLCESEK